MRGEVNRMSHQCWKLILCVGMVSSASVVYGLDSATSTDGPRYQANEVDENQYFSTLFHMDLQSLSSSTGSASAVGFGMTGVYALSRNWGASGRLNQTFSTSGGALYTGWRVAGEYALTGSFLRHKAQTRLGDWKVVESKETPPVGWKLSVGFNQQAFSRSGGSLSFYGFDVAVRKEFSAYGGVHPFVGGEIGQSVNGSQTVSKLQVSGGILLWW